MRLPADGFNNKSVVVHVPHPDKGPEGGSYGDDGFQGSEYGGSDAEIKHCHRKS